MKEVIYITGHKNPDTDSVCAAIAYAEFKNKTQNTPAIPVRLGELNLETKFILDYFKIQPPMLIDTVKVQISDLNIDKIAPVSPDISLKMAWNLMKRNNVKTMPVTNERNNLVGIVSMSNLISSFMDIWDNAILAKSQTPLDNITATLSAKIIYVEESKPYFEGKIVITSISSSSISDTISEEDIAICSDSPDVQKLVIEKGISLLIVTDNNKVEKNIIELAQKNKCSVIVTPHDSFTAARLITQSIPVKYVMTKDNLISFSTEDFVDEIRDVMLENRYRSYPIIGKDDAVIGSISRYHLISKNRKKVILLDHNERSQAVDGLEEAEVLEIIDHHRIADVQTGNPIYFRNEPVGSTSTIIASIFFENGIRPSKNVAGILCAAIISDTLLLKSPTSTIVDQIMLKRLSAIADLDPEKFAKEMFKAGTSLRDKSPEEIFHQDFKAFSINDLKVGVSQIGTLDMEGMEAMKKSILELMNRKVRENGFFILIFMITDILKGGSELIIAGEEKEILSKAFNVEFENNSVYLPGVVSRKKQVIPPISSAIANMK
ncbi:putative manganese-dependent inorganic diphosphatase [Clostridium oryzae]|uniref:inorganic diphosphatase n=1 Tax=Clostridium oryzae TaxID=1450648 RepID=A0A1V4IU01_9CLOT|nr:putative manganese-dependent inorganic diphosphatase [Clostridium oryzae]OPJ63254.1 cobalt-dependent inorganic pyrophosphatase [Clostridium oryzae]